MLLTLARNAAPARTGSGVRRNRSWLLGDTLGAFPSVVLRGLDLLAPFATEDADKAPYAVRVPLRSGHDLGQCRAFGAFQHRDNFRFLVGAFGLRLAGWFLSTGRSNWRAPFLCFGGTTKW